MAYTLGLDVSTQSISAVLLDIERREITRRVALPYRDDARLNRFGIDFESLIVPPREPGESDQPPLMFLAGLDAIFEELKKDAAPLAGVTAIAVSAQQHGHVYLNERASTVIDDLRIATSVHNDAPLATRFREVFSYGTAPIWQTANTSREAEEIRTRVGGRDAMIGLSGSDSPLRFSGAVIRRIGLRYPERYEATTHVSLLSNFISAVLSGNPETPIDWGNGSGMSLMDYSRREWSDTLLEAVAEKLPGGARGLRARLPGIASPTSIAGPIATYFVERYGLDPGCLITIGSGDNPQSKVMTSGGLFSLGSSFVYMVDATEPTIDSRGYANSMYDGIGRPFVFACRTNGAMVWDRTRAAFGADLTRADRALETVQPGSSVAIWQPYTESYPVSPVIPNREIESRTGEFETLYSAVVDSALALSWYYARGFDSGNGPLAVTGGPAHSAPILRRIASIWQRPVYTIGDAGAAAGSAVSAWLAYCDHKESATDPDELRIALLPRSKQVSPDPELVLQYHGTTDSPGYVERLIEVFRNVQ